MAAREKRIVLHVEQSEKLAPFATCARNFRQDGSELATGVNIFPLELWVKTSIWPTHFPFLVLPSRTLFDIVLGQIAKAESVKTAN